MAFHINDLFGRRSIEEELSITAAAAALLSETEPFQVSINKIMVL